MIRDILSNTMVLNFPEPVRIENFTPIQKSDAWQFAQLSYRQAYEEGSYTKEELSHLLEEMDYWTPEDEDDYTSKLETLSLMKVDYFENFPIPSRREQVKRSIDRQMAIINELFIQKNYLHEYTCENIRDESYILHFFQDRPNPLLFYRHFLSSRCSETEVRDLVFDNTWRMIWASCKDAKDIFGSPLSHLNDNQLGLLYWSKLYDNIGESTESPSQAVIRDQIAIDGWMIKQGKKRESEEKLKALPSGAGELFIPVSSKREAREITALNTSEGKRIIKSRASDIKNRGDLDEGQFSHVRQDKQMQMNQLSFGK